MFHIQPSCVLFYKYQMIACLFCEYYCQSPTSCLTSKFLNIQFAILYLDCTYSLGRFLFFVPNQILFPDIYAITTPSHYLCFTLLIHPLFCSLTMQIFLKTILYVKSECIFQRLRFKDINCILEYLIMNLQGDDFVASKYDSAHHL